MPLMRSSSYTKQPGSTQPLTHRSNQPSSEHLDIWEHAALLYHEFEWQDAADAFDYLATRISEPRSRTLCALNASIIQARLGDYRDAQHNLEDAARSEHAFALTTYLLGIVEWELNNFIKAEACLQVSAKALRQGNINYGSFGMDFTLQINAVDSLLEVLRYGNAFDSNARTKLPVPAALPADCIFEAPPRSPTSRRLTGLRMFESDKRKDSGLGRTSGTHGYTASPRSSTSLDAIRDMRTFLSRGSLTPTLSRQLLVPEQDAPRASTSGELLAERWWIGSGQDSSPPPKPRTVVLPKILPLSPVSSRKATPTNSDSRRDSRSVRDSASLHSRYAAPGRPASSILSQEPSPRLSHQTSRRQRPKTPYVPRDPRGEYPDPSELAAFLRPDDHRPGSRLLQRDARVAPESTRELATFVRNANRDRLCVDQKTGMFSYNIARADLLIGAPMPFFNNNTKVKAKRRRSAPQGFLRGLLVVLGGHHYALPSRKARLKQRQQQQQHQHQHQSLRSQRVDFQTQKKIGHVLAVAAPMTGVEKGKKKQVPLWVDTVKAEANSQSRLPQVVPRSQPDTPSTIHTLPASRASTAGGGTTSAQPLELLMPTVYNPEQKTQRQESPKPVKPASPQLLVYPETRRLSWPLGGIHTFHTAASSTSDLFAGSITSEVRTDRARDAALRMLEGRNRSLLPCVQPQGGTRAGQPGKSTPLLIRQDTQGPGTSATKTEKRRRGSSNKFLGKLPAIRWSLDRGLSMK